MNQSSSRKGGAGLSFRSSRAEAAVALLTLATAGCSKSPSILDGSGPGAQEINVLGWVLFVIAGVIFLGVMTLLVGGLFRRRRDAADPREPRGGVMMMVGGGIVLPLLVLGGVFVPTLLTGLAVTGEGSMGQEDELEIAVEARQWWWEVTYPQYGFETANEIHIPVDRPVKLTLTTDDVIHSFWVPQLHGKVDMIPGRTNVLRLEASLAGTYRGQCAEFCGVQHAHMAFHVIADPAQDFDAWVALQTANRPKPQGIAQAGENVFVTTSCAACHTIRGTRAQADAAPDLTHLASRAWLAAGTLENTPENLRAWIEDPQAIKPGNYMPDVELTDEQVGALVAYLSGLE